MAATISIGLAGLGNVGAGVYKNLERNGDREFTDYIRFQLTQDRCDVLDRFKEGQEVKVSFSLRGRKYEKDGDIKYFTNIEAWRIDEKQTSSSPRANLDC